MVYAVCVCARMRACMCVSLMMYQLCIYAVCVVVQVSTEGQELNVCQSHPRHTQLPGQSCDRYSCDVTCVNLYLMVRVNSVIQTSAYVIKYVHLYIYVTVCMSLFCSLLMLYL